MTTQNIEQLITELKTNWHSSIPISQAMQITPISYQDEEFIVTAPLEPNINCHQSMFAGSIASLATLAGWGIFWLNHKLQNVEGNIVLANANILYEAPIHSQPRAKVKWQKTDLKELKAGKKQRVTLNVEVYCKQTLCVIFEGLYVSIPKESL